MILLMASLCAMVSANAVRFAYLPPLPSPPDNITTDELNDTLSQRFGDFNFDSNPSVSALSTRQAGRLISQGIQQLTLDLDHVLASGSMSGGGRGIQSTAASNVIFSPLSIAGALALALLGAGGRTYQELVQVLGLTEGGQWLGTDGIHDQYSRVLTRFAEQPGVLMPTQIISASAIFVQENYPIRPVYRQLSQTLYGSDIISLDFMGRGSAAAAAVNQWVSDKTRGRITDLLSEPPSPDTRLMIASALYFNGAWEHPFPQEVTTKRPFYVTGDAANPGEVVEVTMMANSVDLPFYASPTLGCRVVGLPYKGGEVTMYIVLPNKTGISALRELEQKLTPATIEELATSTKEQSIVLLLPRMKLEASLSLKDALRALGVESLFNPLTANLSLISPGITYQQADDSYPLIFTRIGDNNTNNANEVNENATEGNHQDQMVFRQRRQIENPGLYADDAVHRVEIEITETGTVASAVTLLSVTRDGSRQNFRVDRPFFFFIRHEPTGLILFWGSVVRPTPSTAKLVRPVK